MAMMNRRQLLLGAAGIGVVSLAGGGYFAVRSPQLEFIESVYEAASEESKILVAYSSTYGSTGGIADAIAQGLKTEQTRVDVIRLTEEATIDNLDEYTAFVIGSPVISSAWMPEAVSFLDENQAVLQKRPVAFFLACMELALSPDPNAEDNLNPVFDDVLAQVPSVTPVSFGLFAGALDYGKMSPANRLLYRYFAEDTTDGDYRDWDAVGSWATDLRPSFLQHA